MLELNILLAISYSFLTLIGLISMWHLKRANPTFWFLIFQWLIGFGVMLLADFTIDADRFFIIGYFLSSIFFILGALTYQSLTSLKSDYNKFFKSEIVADHPSTMAGIKLIFLVSIAVTVLYYSAVGSNLFLNIILGVAIEDFSTMRLNAYSSDEYFAPGYANQFKNVLLPITTSIIGYYFYITKKFTSLKIILIFSVTFLPIALLGTGQRVFLVYSFAAFVFGMVCLNKVPLKNLFIGGILAFSLFSIMTALYKSDQLAGEDNIVISVVLKSFERFFYTEQEDVLVTFRVIYERDIVYFYEWYEGLAGLLPGNTGSYLQHELFAYMHGSDRGTAAVSTVGSILYNGGIFYLMFFYFFIGWFYNYLYHNFLRGKRSLIRIFSYGALFFYLATFVSGGPSSLINNGVAAIAILIFLGKFKLELTKKSMARI